MRLSDFTDANEKKQQHNTWKTNGSADEHCSWIKARHVR